MRYYVSFWFRVFLVWLLLLAGCAAGSPAGRWEVDPKVQQIFESGTVLPGYTYYYMGSYTAPDSIIAIDNQFTLRTRVWAQVDLTPAMLNGWLDWHRTQHKEPACDFKGGVVLTPDGQRAGYWYSPNSINIVRMPEAGVLEVYQPESIAGTVCGKSSDGFFNGGKD